MTQDLTGQRERSESSDVGAIEKGWSVFDALERPVGNVTDVEDGRLRVDGRPQGLGYVNLPLSVVDRTADGDVYLKLRMEDFHEHDPDFPPLAAAASTSAGAAASEPIVRNTADSSGAEQLDRSSYTASDQPIGSASSTPVSGGPDTFRAWDQSVEGGGSNWTFRLAPIGAAAAGATGYLWWRRRTRRNRLQRIGDMFSNAGENAWESARERPWYWWAVALTALPLLLWLRSDDDAEAQDSAERTRGEVRGGADSWPDAATSRGTSWKDQARIWVERPSWAGRSAWMGREGLGEWMPAAEVFAREEEDWSGYWMLAGPAAMLGLAGLWYAFTGRKRSGRSGRLADIMTGDAQTIRPDATIFEAASLMQRLNVGALPVCDGRKLRGMLTDRDIVVRAVADGRDPHLTRVHDAMSSEIVYANATDTIGSGAKLMRDRQIRRLPIVDDDRNLVGIVSLGDLAIGTGDDPLSGETLERISERSLPTH